MKSLETEKILLGNGLLPPKKIKLIKRIIINIFGIFTQRGVQATLLKKLIW